MEWPFDERSKGGSLAAQLDEAQQLTGVSAKPAEAVGGSVHGQAGEHGERTKRPFAPSGRGG
jgi:hypothetical protein